MKLPLAFNAYKISGLSEHEAHERLLRDGLNELPSFKRRGVWLMVLDVAKEPMISLLIIASTIYFFLGDLNEAIFLAASVGFIVVLTLFQRGKTEKALEALRDLSSPRALVVRDGQVKRISGREVVVGDTAILNEGDRIPADGVLLSCENLVVDESALTGESVPVRKLVGSGEVIVQDPGGDDTPFIYSATLVTRGWGIAEVTAIGTATRVGAISRFLKNIDDEPTKLEREVRRIVWVVAACAIGLSILAAVLYGLSRNDWIAGALNGVTLAMAIIPEEIPVMLVVFMAIGAWRLSRKHVLTRKMGAIETLGSTTVLCVDKTGTLTENKMSVRRLITSEGREFFVDSQSGGLVEEFHRLVEYAVLEGHKNPFDPIGVAFKKFVDRYLRETEHIHPEWRVIREYPLSRELRAVCSVWRSEENKTAVVAAKGAPESIIELCKMSAPQSEIVISQATAMANEGLRVFAVAGAKFSGEKLPDDPLKFEFEFLGLIGLEDPIRPSVKQSVQECYRAGVRIIMITGDYPQTAQSIALQAGIRDADSLISGNELDLMSDEELEKKIGSVVIFARAVPEHKLRIITALKKRGEIVAMTGDGVNDAPALKSAHVGVAMGQRGTDVAREASDIVLLHDDFTSLVEAVRGGRRIFDNLRKGLSYIFAIHIPIAGISLVPIVFNWPLVLLPVHIVFFELIIDPACSVVFEAEEEERNLMRRRPRPVKEKILNKPTMISSISQGLAVFLVVFGVFIWGMLAGMSEPELRVMSFVALVLVNIGLILVNISFSSSLFSKQAVRNKSLRYVVSGALFLLAAVIYLGPLRELFKFGQLRLNIALASLGTAVVAVAVARLMEKLAGRFFK